ncbi:MAG TPA: DNA polymerase III subunit delta [Candidatus Saccharimonadales bacterium]|nr:DNA polymerase III subunit delta [Candidatus Saccharimonadales bacterium]
MKSFAPVERFVNDVSSRMLQAGYVFVGDEGFFRRTCRDAILKHLVPEGMREFSFYEFDLDSSEVVEILDRARTPSLMANFQVFFVRGVKALYGRGKHDAEFAAIAAYAKDPNPDALLIFVADHISIPADVRRMEMTDKDRYERIRETLGDSLTIVEFARVDEGEAVKWLNETAALHSAKIDSDASRELVDSLGGDMMMISNELEKLLLYVGEKKRITLGDVETMVLAAKQRTLYELTEALSSHNRAKSLEILDAMLSTGDGDEAAIGHLYMLARTFRQMLVILERNVRDTRALYQVLWQGFRLPPFAAEDVIRQARRYKSRRELTRAIRLISKADAALRTNPVSKRLVLENLVLDLAAEPREPAPAWQQEALLDH